MTTIRQIITDAYRESGLIQIGLTPEAEQLDEGLRRLQTIIRSLFGNELGVPLTSVSYGASAITNTYGREDDYSSVIDGTYVPSNVRLLVNIDGAKTLYLKPNPQDGARISIVDNSGNFGTYNVTVNGNGRKIDGGTSTVLSTNSESKEWFYRADLGEWVVVDSLTADSQSPFPSEFDDLLSIMLAFRLHPRYQAQTAPETMETLRRMKRQFSSRYSQSSEVGVEEALLRLSGTGPSFFDDLPSSERFNSGIIG